MNDHSRNLQFTLEGAFSPYVRVTQRSKRADPAAIRYLHSQESLALQIRAQMQAAAGDPIPGRTPFLAIIHVEMPAGLHCQDLDNQAKAILDAAQGIAFPDDRWLDGLTITGQLADRRRVTLEIILVRRDPFVHSSDS